MPGTPHPFDAGDVHGGSAVPWNPGCFFFACLEKLVSGNMELDEAQRRQRNIAFILFALGIVGGILCFYVAAAADDPSGNILLIVSGALFMVSNAPPLVLMLCGGQISHFYLHISVVVGAVTLSIVDLSERAVPGAIDIWPLFVVVLDGALLLRLDRRVATGIMLYILSWICLAQLESYFRFGLFDLPGSPTQERRQRAAENLLQCGNLPCPNSVLEEVRHGIVAVSVFLTDFLVTRGFADKVLQEKAAMQSTIDTLQQISQYLADYDLDTVRETLLSAEDAIPPEMGAALRCVERNLRLYRPYLPEALFQQLHGESGSDAVSITPPGLATRTATIVFTDIRASTSIWESAPEAMKKAIRLHNRTVRQALNRWGGYEVKTVGDAFMVAFDNPVSGISFALAVHQALLAADWPAPLLQIPMCKRVAGLWGGLTVRVGVNHGPVSTEENAVTRRVDYFGHTVNVAARLEGCCIPGAVAVQADHWEQYSHACPPALAGNSEVVALKGVREPVLMRCIWPEELAGRRGMPLLSPEEKSLQDSLLSGTHTVSLVRSAPALRVEHATVGVVSLVLGQDTAASLNTRLKVMLSCLERSGGTLVTVLGTHVVMGWNLARASDSHVENSLKFVRLLRRRLGQSAFGAAGIVTGRLEFGDVGSASQRFVTVVGQGVRVSWSLCDWAERNCIPALYATLESSDLPVALVSQLTASDTRCQGLPTLQLYELYSGDHSETHLVSRFTGVA